MFSETPKESIGMKSFLSRLVRPLASRKVRVAFATVVAAYAAEWGLGISEELVLTILGTGVALILGVAVEDAGRFAGGVTTKRLGRG